MRLARALAPASGLALALALALCAGACGNKGERDQQQPGGSGSGSGSGGGSGAGAAAAGSGARADAQAKLEVKVAGQPAAIQRALVKRMDPDRYQIYLSTSGGTCAELLDNMFDAKGRVDVLASVSPRLGADGKQHLQITDVFEGAPTMVLAPGARVSITGAAAPGEQVPIALDFVATAADAAAKGLAVEVHGSFIAEGCGSRAPEAAGVPRAPHPTTAALTIARQRLELKGAIVRGAGKSADVLLSTAPKDCSGVTPWAAVILERTGGRWRATGTWLEHELRAGDPPPALAAALGATGQSADGPTVQLALSGAGDLGGYPVALEGVIEALVCK